MAFHAPIQGGGLNAVIHDGSLNGAGTLLSPLSVVGIPATSFVADSITGNGTAGTPLKLVNDTASPGNSKYYGTDGTGTRGFFDLSTSDPALTANQIAFGSGSNLMTSSANLTFDPATDTFEATGITNGFYVSSSDNTRLFKVGQGVAELYLQVDAVNTKVSMGDILGFANSTQLIVDDNFANERITAQSANQFLITNPTAKNTALFNTGNHNVSLGDISADTNGTEFILNNGTQTYTFNKPNFIINSVPYVYPASNAVGQLTNDGAGNLTWTADPSVSLTVGSTAISGGTTTRILFDNAGVLGEYTLTGTAGSVVMSNTPTITTPALNGTVTGTGVSQSVSNLTLLQRDGNGNAFANNAVVGYADIVSGGTTTTLTAASAHYIEVTGTNTQTIELPDATTLTNGWTFEILNDITGHNVTIENGAGGNIFTLPPNGHVVANLVSNLSSNGTWKLHQLLSGSTPGGNLMIAQNGYWDSVAMGGDATINTTGNLALAIVNSNAGTFGDSTHVGQFTVGAKGLITSASNVLITGTSPGGAAGGDLSGSYPNPTVATVNGHSVPQNVATNYQTGKTINASTTTAVTFTPAVTGGTYTVGGFFAVTTAGTGGAQTLTVTYQDENGTSRSLNISSYNGGGINFNSTGNYSIAPMTFVTNNSAISMNLSYSGGTGNPTIDYSAFIRKDF